MSEKIPIKNIYYMLSYAFKTLRQAHDDKVSIEHFDHMHNLFAAILAKGIGQQLKQGLYKEYIPRKDNLTALRGKIDLAGTIANKLAKRQQLTCQFDDLSANNLLNQILKTTIKLLLRYAEVAPKYKAILKREILYFADVDEIDFHRIKWSTINFHRHNQTYRILIGVCQLLIEGMLVTEAAGEYKFAAFIDDQQMSRLYEKFILEYYTKEHPELKVSAAQIPWALDEGTNDLLPKMQSDVMLTNRAGDTVLIIDAKYYTNNLAEGRFNKKILHAQNLYQIFTYVKNKAVSLGAGQYSISGMLLYAKTNAVFQPANRYQMSGNKISVRTLDLNQDFCDIKCQLDDIVKEHFVGDVRIRVDE